MKKINETVFYAFWQNKKHEIEADNLWDAKQKAIIQLKVPKSKIGLLAVVSKKSQDNEDFKFEQDKKIKGIIEQTIKKVLKEAKKMPWQNALREFYNIEGGDGNWVDEGAITDGINMGELVKLGYVASKNSGHFTKYKMTKKGYDEVTKVKENMKKSEFIKLVEAIVRRQLNENIDRPIYEIAQEIKDDWKNINYAAMPYLSAMMELDKITDDYYADSASSIIAYFLSNAAAWRGEKAKQIKKELNNMLK